MAFRRPAGRRVLGRWKPLDERPTVTPSTGSSSLIRRLRDLERLRDLRRLRDDRGAVTAEYAVVIMAAVAFAGALTAVLRSGAVQGMLSALVQRALNVG
jgi:Flp pilus assembly pilin Flp